MEKERETEHKKKKKVLISLGDKGLINIYGVSRISINAY